MKTKRKMSLKWRIFTAISAIMLIILALLWVCQTVFLNSFYKAVKVYETKQVAETIAKNINDEDIDYQIAALSNQHDVSIKVLDADFKSIYAASAREMHSFFGNIPDSEFYSFYSKAKENGGTYTEYFEGFGVSGKETGNKKMPAAKAMPTSFIISKITPDNAGGYDTIIVNAGITPVDSVITTLRVILIFVTALTVVLVLITALILSAGLSKPLKKISDKAKVLATGDYDVEFEPSTVKEIDELADSLNYAKTELGKMDTLQKELIANISHDLRTPLTLIGGYAEVMRDIPGEATDENLQVIIDESKRLTGLVNDVLDISKLSAGVGQMQPEVLDLKQCIEAIIPRYNKLVEKDRYQILFSYGSIQTAPVCADRTRLEQVIYNLVNNAVTYTGEDKTVRIELLEKADSFAVHIIDSGEGIEEDKLPLIWERYYKVDKAHRRAQMGSGLGLSIVKQILDAHSAAYGVNSTPGKGSDFWFEMKKAGLSA